MSTTNQQADETATAQAAEEIATEWTYKDGDPATPEGARHFAAMLKAATGREVRATFLRDDPERGDVFAVRDIDRETEAKRKADALEAYGDAYAQAVRRGIKATAPDMIDWEAAVDGAATIADEADDIESATRRLRDEIAHYEPLPADVIEAEERERIADAIALARAVTGETPPTAQSRAQTRPGRYRHNANVGGISQKEAAAILTGLNEPTNERTIRRWLKGDTKPPAQFPGLEDKQTFMLWAANYAQRGDMAVKMKNHLPLKETATEAANMKRTGRSQPCSCWQ